MDEFAGRRARMVERQLRERGIVDERVLAAMGEGRREAFVPERRREMAYADAGVGACGPRAGGGCRRGPAHPPPRPGTVPATPRGWARPAGESVLEVGT